MDLPPLAIFGASGFIGRHLAEYFSHHAEEVWGSYCHGAPPKRGQSFHYDLLASDPEEFFDRRKNIQVAVLCAGITNVERCKNNLALSTAVNGAGLKRLVQELAKRRIRPVFLSSDCVFDGKKAEYREIDRPGPTTVYGRQKVEVEEFIKERSEKYLIVRLSKIFGTELSDGSLFTSWLEKAAKKEKIFSARDQFIQPTWAGDLARSIHGLLKNDLGGVYHLASAEFSSRLALAQKFFAHLDLDPSLIVDCSIHDFNLAETRAEKIRLCSDKFHEETGCRFRSTDECFEEILEKTRRRQELFR
ncbi:MAG: SDR family oxidoreductase [Planctomycetes bacterium]|nr:SDR family oxidoreductase [Planctomycetota bacterium]